MASEDFARRGVDARSFLLIVCTERIVTPGGVPSDSPDVPAFSRMRTPPLLATGASDSLTLGPL
jgi:hypothetical protein